MTNTTISTSFTTLRHLVCGAAAALLLVAAGGAQAQTYINATVGGELAPGVYGRINIGNAPPPPLIYAEPVIIHRPAVVVPRAPIYLYVPRATPRTGANTAPATTPATSPCTLCRSPRHARAPSTATTRGAMTAAGTTTTATAAANTTVTMGAAMGGAMTGVIAESGAKAVARAMATGTDGFVQLARAPLPRTSASRASNTWFNTSFKPLSSALRHRRLRACACG